ncbi:MAG: NADH-quinone oxidoreductase subunit N [Fimbriimonadaceae bacterium]|nr:NADH-quinone oxidoreductase subunit N [Fimbriimonadaceae bacterium]
MINFPIPATDWSLLLPIAMVALTGIFALIIEMVQPKRDNGPIVAISLFGLLLAAIQLGIQFQAPETVSFAGTVRRDAFSLAMQLVIVLGSMATILFSDAYLRAKKIPFAEFYPLMLWSTVGGMLMCASTNLLVIFVGLEILSISLYVLAGISRNEAKSEESAMKYFLLGAFASGFLLFGVAQLYGATGSLDLNQISPAWQTGDVNVRTLLVFGLGLLLIGMGFKASFFPFHQWTPDVYQGAPTNVTAFMATAGKTAAFAVLYRLLEASRDLSAFWVPALGVIAALTMLYGNIVALQQTDVKRILGYSSISHAGYILVALMAHGLMPDKIGPQTVVYYALTYTFTTVGSFAVVALSARDSGESTELADLRGLLQRDPISAVSLVVFMSALIGIPPGFSGLFGKLFIFQDAVAAGLLPLALVLAVSSIVSVSYYLNIAYQAVVAPREEGSEPVRVPAPGTIQAACAVCVFVVVAAAIAITPITNLIAPK